ncbi:DUF2931 family protein [Vibrio owensii]|uniref:DUF2931 family protein n=1 Tax=Vibrio owensii TaxID=696485 RepID=UPI0038CF1AED
MPLRKTIKYLTGVLIVLNTASCSTEAVEIPPDYPNWQIGFTYPFMYPVSPYRDIYGVNEEQDWTSYLHRPYNPPKKLWKVRNVLDDQSYDGFGVQLGDVQRSKQVAPTNSLPDQIYVKWMSIYDYADYFTVINITPEMKKVMLTPHPHPRGVDYPCYQNEFTLGLLPDGRAKLWLSGCLIYTYVGEFEPKTKKFYDGDEKRAPIMDSYEEQAKAKAVPVPWDKVNKVYYPKERFTMNTLEEALNESKRDH